MKNVARAILLPTICCVVATAQVQSAAESLSQQVAPRSEFVWVNTPQGRLGGRAYINTDSITQPVLAIVLHGDLLKPDNSYHYDFARTVAAESPNVVVVGLLRPGYSDEAGNRSDGDMLKATGDNYTADVVATVAFAARELQKRYRASTTVLIGHSGGAAITALTLGRHPDVATAALLVACPCDLPAWRAHMMSVRPNPVWQEPHLGLSPLDAVSGVRPTSVVELMVGEEDDVVRAEYSQHYAAALRKRGVEATVTLLPTLGHNILQRPPVIAKSKELLRRARKGN